MNTRVELPSSSSLDGKEEMKKVRSFPAIMTARRLLTCLPAVSGSVVLVLVIVQGHTFVLNVAKYNL